MDIVLQACMLVKIDMIREESYSFSNSFSLL